MPALRANRFLEGLSPLRQIRVEVATKTAGRESLLTRVLQQADDKGRLHGFRPAPAAGARLGSTGDAIGGEAMLAAFRQDVRPGAQVVEQRQLQSAGPRPQLANGQWRDGLKRRDEPVQPLRIEPARAMADELHRHRIHAGQAGELISGHRRQPAIERGRQVVTDVTRRRGDGVEVVEQPFSGRRRSLTQAYVLGQVHVDVSQRLHVPVEPFQVRLVAHAPLDGHRQERRETARVFFERLDAEQFEAAVDRSMHAGDLTDRLPHARHHIAASDIPPIAVMP